MIALLRKIAGFCFCTLSFLICSCSQDSGSVQTDATDESSSRSIAYQSEPGPSDEDAPSEFTETESGLKYRILRKSKGVPPNERSTVFVHYRGWLDDGTEFDSSYVEGNPIDFRVGNVVDGWAEGLQLIGKGGMIELEIPPELGYGAEGSPGAVPPNAQLHFIVEVIEVF